MEVEKVPCSKVSLDCVPYTLGKKQILITELDKCKVDEYGNFMWEWDDSQLYDPMWDTEKPHGFRFHVYFTAENAFVIESEGWYGAIRKRTRARGRIEGMFQFSYFSANDMAEFACAGNQTITGKVHANGNLFVKPEGGTTRFNTSSFTATGFIIRSRDVFHRPDTGGIVEITENSEGGNWVEMEPGFESLNPLWSDRTNGARALWGGVVRDKVPYKSSPPIRNLDPGEYYDQNAGLKINDNTHISKGWCTQATIPNWAEQMYHVAEDIDVAAMIAAGDWPANGLIYCSTIVRLYNAEVLDGPLMLASNSTVYLKGNFNNTVDKVAAAIMSKHRVYILSSNPDWDDNNPDAYSINSPVAEDTTINAAIVDGIPPVNAYNYVDLDKDGRYDCDNSLIYADAGTHNYPPNRDDPWGPIDDLLEDWGSGSKTLTKSGSTVHLGGAVMADNLGNSDITTVILGKTYYNPASGKLGWVRRRGYWWPTRNYSYDPDLATPSGQPPFTPLIGNITSWEPY